MTPEQLAAPDTEHSHQVALFAWAATQFAQYPQLKYMFAIPNGGERNKAVASRLKAEGVKSGVYDILLPWPVRLEALLGKTIPVLFCGMFIEMKAPRHVHHLNGGRTAEQVEFGNKMAGFGYKVVTCHSWQDARDEIVAYLKYPG